MTQKTKHQAQNPLILRCHRLMEAFAKSDDERDFYLDRDEGFIIYVDLDKDQGDLAALEKELTGHMDRYCLIPKLTFYETKKIMEGFVNEKVYDIDTKEKLLDIIQSKEAREHFLEFIYDHHSELEKWQQYYQERWRIRIIEWLRKNGFQFVFEEDLDLSKKVIEKLKESLFDPKVGKDILAARKVLASKAKTYYSNEALNPRPKRGRPPKQAAKLEIEPQVTLDIYTTVPSSVRSFLFTPDITSASSVTFSSKFENQEELLSHRKNLSASAEATLISLNQKLATFKNLQNQLLGGDKKKHLLSLDDGPDDEELMEEEEAMEDLEDATEIDEETISPSKRPSKTTNNHHNRTSQTAMKNSIAIVHKSKAISKANPKVKAKATATPALKSAPKSKTKPNPLAKPRPKPLVKVKMNPAKKGLVVPAKKEPPKKMLKSVPVKKKAAPVKLKKKTGK